MVLKEDMFDTISIYPTLVRGIPICRFKTQIQALIVNPWPLLCALYVFRIPNHKVNKEHIAFSVIR